MKIKMSQAVNSVPTFNHLAQQEVPVTTACDLYDITQALEPHLETFRKVRSKLNDKYQVPTEQGMRVADDKKADFERDVEELLNREVEISIPTLDPNGFGDLKLSFGTIGAIRFAFPPRDAPDLSISKEEEDE